MEKIKYANFHSHDGYSLLDGLDNAKSYIDASIERGIYSAGITNHGNTSSVLHYYDYGKKKGFPVMLGSEFYIESSDVIFADEDKRKELNKYYHLIVIAKDKEGYENLMKLSSLSFDPKRFYRRPRISFDDLFENKKGLVVTSACIAGPIAQNILKGDLEKAWQYSKMFKEQFGDDWFLEIETIDTSWNWNKEKGFYQEPINTQETANRHIIDISKDLKIPVVIGLDSHMVDKKSKEVQDVAIQTGPSSNGWHFWDTYYLKTPEEMWEECQRLHPYITREQFKEWCENTVVIADKCKVNLDFKPQLPQVYPENTDKLQKLYEIVLKKNRIPWDNPVYVDRLKLEIEVIHKNSKIDLLDYFFVLEDLIAWCNQNKITVGPGRGSACGSLLTYAMGITSIDPIKYNLLFERFLSISRIEDGSLPDIDLDFSDPDAAKGYLRQRYGEDKVFSIGTVQQIKIKQAFTDICRVVLGAEFNYFQIKELTSGLPGTGPQADLELITRGCYEGHLIDENERNEEIDKKIKDAISVGVLGNTFKPDWNKKWRKWVDEHPKGKKIYEIMLNILGLPRQSGVHACFSGDMRLYTEFGYMSFESLNGRVFKIPTPQGWKSATVFENGEKDIYEHRIRSSKSSNKWTSLRCTLDHSFKAKDGEYKELSSCNELNQEDVGDFSNDYVLMGWMSNDGSYGGDGDSYYFYFTPGKDEEALVLLDEKRCGPGDSGGLNTRRLYVGYSRELTERVKIKYDRRRNYDNDLPEGFDKLDVREKLSWLRGMFSANAYFSPVHRSIELATTSEKLIRSIMREMKELGFTNLKFRHDKGSKVQFKEDKEYQGRDTYCLSLQQQDCILYEKLIGVIQSYKRESLREITLVGCKTPPYFLGKKMSYDFSLLEEGEKAGIVEGIYAHNCAVAISREPMDKRIATALHNGTKVTQFTASWCEYAGIIKFDILGLNTLKDLQACCDLVKERVGHNIDIYNIPVDDKMVFERFLAGDTETVFQFNTNLQKHLLKEIGCESIGDLAAVTAIARPGPLSLKVNDDYAKGKKDPNSVRYEHPVMKEVTGDTHGVIIYQEQIMKFFNKVGGLSLTESEEVRRAISKYKAHLMKKYQGQFLEYTTTKLNPVLSEKDALALWNKIEKYCAYSFNLSHATAYAYVGYVCQWMKTHYPLEWWCAVLKNSDSDDFKEFYGKIPSFIELVNPDINYSRGNFYVDVHNRIVIPFSKIKSVGPAVVEEIVKHQPYTNFFDFMEKVNKRIVKKNVVEALILSGCFDKLLNVDRLQLIAGYYLVVRKEKTGVPKEFIGLDRIQVLEKEQEYLEYKSVNYLNLFPDLFNKTAITFKAVREKMKGHGAYVGGKIATKSVLKTKKGKEYCQISLYNDSDTMKVKFWESSQKSMYNPIQVGDIVQVYGEIDNFNDDISLNGKDLQVVVMKKE